MSRHSARRSPGYLRTLVLGTAAAVLALFAWLALAPVPPAPAGRQAAHDATAPTRTAATAPAPGGAATASNSPTEPPPSRAPAVTVALAGDVHFTGRTEALLEDPGTAFGPITEVLAAADVAVVNLETAITERGVEAPKEFHFRAPPAALDALAGAGIDVATLANNHAVDYGSVGLDDTLAAIGDGPIPVVGIGSDAAAAYAPYRVEVRGVGISIFGASQVPDWTYREWTATDSSPGIASTAQPDRLLAGISQAAAAGDVVLVYVHWGEEGAPCPTPEMAALANDLAAAGADAIVGTHAHLLLGAGYLDRQTGSGSAYVAYGLGNFLWWRPAAASDDTGVLTLTLQGGVVTGSDFAPARIDGAGRPQPVVGPDAQEHISAFEDLRACTDLLPTPAV